MRSIASKRYLIVFAAVMVLVSLSFTNYIGGLRLKPEVAAVDWIAEKPNYDDHLLNIHQRAVGRLKSGPEGADAFLPIYDAQNPGFFLLVAEMFVRAGATTPLPLEILSIVLFNIGVICFFFWTYFLFGELIVASFATAFLALSKFLLFFPGVTHTMPYEFMFFNITIMLFMMFLKNNKRAYLAGALIAMFMTCMNYWFYYMSTWIIMIGLWWQMKGRPRLKDVALISLPPVAGAFLTTIMAMWLEGGPKQGLLRLAGILAARLVDARVPGASWYPDQRFMKSSDWLYYPLTVVGRLEWSYSFVFFWFALAAAWALFLLSLHNRKAFVSTVILIVGGCSWYYVMFQHTHIHPFSGQYSFMAVCPIFGLIISETIFCVRRTFYRTFMPVKTAPVLTENEARPGNAGRAPSGRRVTSAFTELVMAALLVAVVSTMVWTYLRNTYDLIDQTVQYASVVEVKYKQAIRDICRQHSEITLADLQSASRDWGFKWDPQLIVGTDQTPKCSN